MPTSPPPARDRRIRRSQHTPMPNAWAVLAHEWWGVSKEVTWDCWQGIASCPWTEVVTFRQQLLLWPTITTGRAAAVSHGVRPQDVLHIVDLLVKDRRVSKREAAQIEEAVLAHVDARGAWKE
jgi:hypothetical protein